jgi:predicted amidophosphoribosyltransferase
MNDQPAHDAAPVDTSKGVLCAKCDHLNLSGSVTCEYCHSALFEPCRHCGKTVRRTAHRCEFCGHHTQPKSKRHSRLWRQIFRGGHRITLWQMALWVVAVYCAYRVVVIFSQ